jgi:hypothetical protein
MFITDRARPLERCRICGGLIVACPSDAPTEIYCTGCYRTYDERAAAHGITLAPSAGGGVEGDTRC